MKAEYENLEYRQGVIAYIYDADGNFLLVNLKEYKENEWNFVGGGKDEGENDQQALFREIKEELNLDPTDFTCIHQCEEPLKYDFTDAGIEEGIKRGRLFRGQIKEQFFMKFIGDKKKIKIEEDEINKGEWVRASDLEKYLIFPDQYIYFISIYEKERFFLY